MSEQKQARNAILTEAQIKAFQDDGAVVIRDVLDADLLARLEQLVEDVLPQARSMAKYDADRNDGRQRKVEDATFLSDFNWMTHLTARDIFFNSPIVQIAAEGMRTKHVRLYEDLLMYRRPGSQTPTPWHQDSPLWPMEGEQMCSIWFSLNRMTPEAGALRFIAGSHKGPAYMQYVPKSRKEAAGAESENAVGQQMPEIEGHEDQFKILTFSTEPSDVILFSPKAIHATYGATSGFPKRSFSIRYLGDDIRWAPKPFGTFHRWMQELPLKPGDAMEHERFPQVWPRAQ
jgi:ectoine hydroxylase-related dioxygenase (phytanoyl-CoA dioxygenase family)